jgi:hypothetical protein
VDQHRRLLAGCGVGSIEPRTVFSMYGVGFQHAVRMHYLFRGHVCKLNAVEFGYNDFSLYNTSFIASDILWYQLVPYC